MASRAKKKASLNPQVEATQKVEVKVENNNAKWSNIHLATTIVLLLVLFFMIMLSPTLFAKIKMSLTGSEEDAAEQSFNVTMLDIMFAPVRGCNSGFRFMLEKMGAEVGTQSKYEALVELIGPLLDKDAVEKMDSLGVSLLILTYILFAIYIAQVVLNILDIKLKKNALFSLIGNGLFFAISLAYLIFALAINVNTIFTSSSINATWGLWLIFFISIAQIAINIATWVNGSKRAKNEDV